MRKARKTRKEKIIADLRRSLQTQATGQIIVKKAPLPQTHVATTINSYPYLTHDLLKTFLLTAGIIVLEFLLIFAQKQNLIAKIGF